MSRSLRPSNPKLTRRTSQKKSLFDRLLSKNKTPKPATAAETGGRTVASAEPQAVGDPTRTTWIRATTPPLPGSSGTAPQPLRPLAREDRNRTVPAPPADVSVPRSDQEDQQAQSLPSDALPVPGGRKPKGRGRPAGLRALPASEAVVLEEAHRDVLAIGRIRERVEERHRNKVEAVLEALQFDGVATMSVDELVAATNTIGDVYDGRAEGDADTARIVQLMRRIQQVRDQIKSKINTETLDQVPLPKLRLLAMFLDANQGLVDYLADRNIDFAFRSGSAKGQGGGVYRNGTVHLDGLDSESPHTFVRLLLHETGHATLQRLLMPEDRMPDKTLPDFWDTGIAHDRFTERERLHEAVRTGQLRPDDPAYVRRIAEIEADFAKDKANDLWNDLSEETKRLYRAWAVLRQNNGEYLLGIDMGAKRDEDQRRKYQADNFTEFCAETFMQVATGDIVDHLAWIRTSPTVPAEILDAWNTAAKVLDESAGQRILGRRLEV
jgi:hypothetical protein